MGTEAETKTSTSSSRPIKIVFLVFNAIFGILGFACLVLGIYIKFSFQTTTPNDAVIFNTMVYMLVFVGFFTIVFSILGFLGAAYDNICLIVVYFMLTLAMFVLLLAAGAYGFKQATTDRELEFTERTKLSKSVLEYYDSEEAKNFTDQYQQEHKCCGYSYEAEQDYVKRNQSIPDSCVATREDITNPDTNTNTTVKVYKNCYTNRNSLGGYYGTAGALCIGFALIALICLIISVLLCGAIRKS